MTTTPMTKLLADAQTEPHLIDMVKTLATRIANEVGDSKSSRVALAAAWSRLIEAACELDMSPTDERDGEEN